MQQQNMNMQNQARIMQEPPQIISTKDSLYLTDMLSWNLLAMKKAHFFAQQCQDQELKSEIEKFGQMHQRHYEQILSHLNQNQTFSM
ncbi:hypothetical protein H1Z61_07215 [Bacillus aquiflavi]|uniref:Spore coat protein n=1 Tax=Bacillus aquiflavi TaxID=2672567 RepID=A0A6B3W2Y7_9BACI|nr:hypothetical protein [Bacillus aquiflavi]MBA4536937.1 hypothetical protein [Bacillus aquiflavi]NEY82323.1 hypothetical protein [Bacillus aquiflavi]UAC47754.1 hypothetical protein K6959_14170 [Bacillus aquiflavi]